MKNEIWKDIPNFDGWYQASNLGNFRSYRIDGIRKNKRSKPKNISGFTDSNGYILLHLTINNKSKQYFAHRLVALTFIPNPKNKPFINHINGKKDDNRSVNLEWCTAKENMQHAVRTGLQPIYYGERHPNSKLTREDVNGIKEMWASGYYTQREVAKEYDTDQGTVSRIVNDKLWREV